MFFSSLMSIYACTELKIEKVLLCSYSASHRSCMKGKDEEPYTACTVTVTFVKNRKIEKSPTNSEPNLKFEPKLLKYCTVV